MTDFPLSSSAEVEGFSVPVSKAWGLRSRLLPKKPIVQGIQFPELPHISSSSADPSSWKGDLLLIGVFQDDIVASGIPPNPCVCPSSQSQAAFSCAVPSYSIAGT